MVFRGVEEYFILLHPSISYRKAKVFVSGGGGGGRKLELLQETIESVNT